MRLLPEPGIPRILAAATLVNTIGNGLYAVAVTLFLVRVVGLSVTEFGIALTAVALVVVVASSPMGYFADRYGPREVMAAFLTLQGGLGFALVFVRGFWSFLAVGILAAVVDAGQRGARGALIGVAVPPAARVRTRAYLRAVTNLGMALGAMGGGIGLAVDTPLAYRLLIAGNAATYLLAAAVGLRVPHVPGRPRTAGPRLTALRDRPFLAFVALDGLLSVHHELLGIAVPLWVATRTAAPRWIVAVLFLVNTTMVIALQVRASRGAEEVPAAARVVRRGSLFIAAACLLFAASTGRTAGLAVTLLVTGALVHVLGELWHSAGGWGLSFGLAPPHAQGEYQGAAAMGVQLGRVVGPVAITTLVIGWGVPGWFVLAGGFAAVGLLVPTVAAWAARHRTVRTAT